MNEICDNIKKFRLQLHYTQEKLAQRLCVSHQTISKWERGEGYPDLEMLIALSRVFDVSVDSLLGLSKAKEEEYVKEISTLWEENERKGNLKENEILIRKALVEYPENGYLMVQLAATLEKLASESERSLEYLKESIALQERLLEQCTNDEIVNATRYNICFTYWKAGEKERALEAAKRLPGYYKSRENALTFFSNDEEKERIAREALHPICWSLCKHLLVLAETTENASYIETASQIIVLLKKDLERKRYSEIMREINNEKNQFESENHENGRKGS